VITIDDFLTLVRDELGLEINPADAERSLDEVAGWDSVHLLALAGALERTTGHPIMLPDLLEAGSLAGIYKVAVTS
jgi:acyl carrier protein